MYIYTYVCVCEQVSVCVHLYPHNSASRPSLPPPCPLPVLFGHSVNHSQVWNVASHQPFLVHGAVWHAFFFAGGCMRLPWMMQRLLSIVKRRFFLFMLCTWNGSWFIFGSIYLSIRNIYIYTVEIWCAVFLSFGSNLIFTSARTRSRPQPIDIPGFLVTWCYFDMLWYNNYKIRVCQNITWVTFSTCLRSMINSQGHLERNTVRPRRQSRQANALKLNKVCPYPKYFRQMGEKLKGTEFMFKYV